VGVLLGIAYGASCGGVATLIGTPPNGVLAGLPMVTEIVGSSDWFFFAAPLSLFLLVLVFTIVYLVFVRGVKLALDDSVVRESYAALGPVNRDELAVMIIQIMQFGSFLIRKDVINNPEVTGSANLKGVNDATLACAAALLLFFVPSVKRPGEPVLTWDVAQQQLPWGVLLLMGGGFAIAKGFQESQLTRFVGELLAEFLSSGRFLTTFFIASAVCLLTEVTSNTATANVILPILAAVSSEILVHPLALLLPATVACSFAFMLPAATPPNSVVFATRRLGIGDFLRAGICLNLLAMTLGSLLIYVLAAAVYDVDAPFPREACLKEQCLWVDIPGLVRDRRVNSQACAIQAGGGWCSLYDGTRVELNGTRVVP